MSIRLAVSAADPERADAAAALAAALGWPVIALSDRLDYDYLLIYQSQQLELCPGDVRLHGPVYVDFVEGKAGYRLRSQEGRKQPLGRAIGLKPGYHPRVIDGTAGLGRDGFVLASLGCQVTLVERSPVIAALLRDGLDRAGQDPVVGPIVREQLSLVEADTASYLGSLPEAARPDVVYLDPMYPHRQKSALVKKEMRAFRAVVGEDPDAGKMLAAALTCARKRVAVKRPKGAEPLPGPAPSLEISSPNTRYDIYLIPQTQAPK